MSQIDAETNNLTKIFGKLNKLSDDTISLEQCYKQHKNPNEQKYYYIVFDHNINDHT
jgi:hypothetical protein